MSFEQYKKLLAEFVSFKSISTDASFKNEIKNTVYWLKKLFEGSGFTVEIWGGKKANPVVFAEYKTAEDAKNVLVYGHYDVQPANKEDGWNDEPFELSEKDNRLVARGVVDNKGQVLVHIFTVLALIKGNKLKYNVQFVVEGNEETGGGDLPELLQQNKDKLKADYVLISDGEIAGGKPVVEYSLRGGFNSKLTYKTANTSVHSGIYGGAIPNAAHELNKLISKVHDENGKVKFDWFYADVDKIPTDLEKENAKILENTEEFLSQIGVKKFTPANDYDFYTQTGLQPTIQITGLKAGYTEDGYANIIPDSAEVRFNFRTVTSQKEDHIAKKFKAFIKENTPDYVEWTFETSDPYSSIKVDINSDQVAEVTKLLEKAFDDNVLKKPVGGGIPIVSDFKSILGKDTLLVSLGNEDCNMHGVNENFKVDLVKKGLKFSELFFGK